MFLFVLLENKSKSIKETRGSFLLFRKNNSFRPVVAYTNWIIPTVDLVRLDLIFLIRGCVCENIESFFIFAYFVVSLFYFEVTQMFVTL